MDLDPSKFLSPFLESVGMVEKLGEETLKLPLSRDEGELVMAFLQEIREQRLLVERLGPDFIRNADQSLDAGMQSLARLRKEKEVVLEEMAQMKQRVEAAIVEAQKAAEEHAKKNPRPIPVPSAKLPEPAKPLELSEGGVLRELLLPTAALPVAQAPKVAGNIWENWRKVGDAPVGEDELGPDEDLEG